jgi:hypothetical protein
VTTKYKDLAGESYETTWNLKPTIFEDDRYIQNKGIQDVARSLEEISGDLNALLNRREEADNGRDGVSREKA